MVVPGGRLDQSAAGEEGAEPGARGADPAVKKQRFQAVPVPEQRSGGSRYLCCPHPEVLSELVAKSSQLLGSEQGLDLLAPMCYQ